MTVYALAQISITDRAAYGRYQNAFMGVLDRYGGRLLCADENPSVEEGSWAYDKVVVVAFDDEPAFRRWAESADYQAIAVDRRAGSHGVVLLAHGA